MLKSIFFINEKECLKASLEGRNFKIFWPVGPNHGGASLDGNLSKPQQLYRSQGFQFSKVGNYGVNGSLDLPNLNVL